jgi:ubiquinone biosynthesis protein COQ4
MAMTEQVQLMSDEAKRVYVRAHGMLPHELAYMRGDQQPVAGSVLTSTSVYRNSPLFCHAFLNMALRRSGDDVAITYDIPDMVKGIADVQDWAANSHHVQLEREKNPEFGAWLDARKTLQFDRDQLEACAPGTLGHAVNEFIEASGYEMFFMRTDAPANDFEFIQKMMVNAHDMSHIVSGFGTNMAGEHAVNSMTVASIYKYFSPEVALAIGKAANCTTSTFFANKLYNYPQGVPVMIEAMTLGLAAGQAVKMPLFMVDYDPYLEMQLDDVAADLGFKRGPGKAWDEYDPLLRG